MLKKPLRLLKPPFPLAHLKQAAVCGKQSAIEGHKRCGGRIAARVHTQHSFHAFAASFRLMVPSTPLTNGQDSSAEYLRVSSTASLMATGTGTPPYCIS